VKQVQTSKRFVTPFGIGTKIFKFQMKVVIGLFPCIKEENLFESIEYIDKKNSQLFLENKDFPNFLFFYFFIFYLFLHTLLVGQFHK